MNTTRTPLSPGTVPADYVPRKGDVLHSPITGAMFKVLRVDDRNVSYMKGYGEDDWGANFVPLEVFTNAARKSNATLARAKE